MRDAGINSLRSKRRCPAEVICKGEELAEELTRAEKQALRLAIARSQPVAGFCDWPPAVALPHPYSFRWHGGTHRTVSGYGQMK